MLRRLIPFRAPLVQIGVALAVIGAVVLVPSVAIASDATTVHLSGVNHFPPVSAPDSIMVTLKDAQNGVDTSYAGTVTFSSTCGTNPDFTITPNNGGGGNAKKYDFVGGDAGKKAFQLTWGGTGNCDFTVSALLSNDSTVTDTVTGVRPGSTQSTTTTSPSTTTTSTTAPPAGKVGVVVTGAGKGGGPHVQAITTANNPVVIRSFMAYDPNFTGGVFVALGDVNGDGFDDIVTGAGPGGGPHVKVWSGADNSILMQFMAYSASFTGGVTVAAGDVNGDGKADIITGAGPGGGPHVKVFSGASSAELGGFMAYAPSFTGGVTVGAADVDNDGHAEIITGAGPGGGPHVREVELDGTEVAGTPAGGFMAYAPSFTGGVYVGGHVDGGSVARIITGAGPGGGQHVRVWTPAAVELAGVIPSGSSTQGATVALGNIDSDSTDEYLIGNATGSPIVRVFDLPATQLAVSPPAYAAPVGVRLAIGAIKN